MKTKHVLPLLLVAAATGCRTSSITIQAGSDGEFETRLAVNKTEVVVTSKGGRLLIDGKDRGPIRKGDTVTIYSNGAVHVNGHAR